MEVVVEGVSSTETSDGKSLSDERGWYDDAQDAQIGEFALTCGGDIWISLTNGIHIMELV